MNAPAPVLLFDGECGLCNRVVRTLLRWDRRSRLRFAALQGFKGQAFLRAHDLPTQDFSTVIFVADWEHPEASGYLEQSSAVVAALRVLGGLPALLGSVLWLIPRPLRDVGYTWVGHLRYRLFGEWRACPLPRAEWRQRILD